MTPEQRAAFDRDGYLIIRGALGPDEAADAREAIDRVYAAMAKAGALGPDGSMHLLSATPTSTSTRRSGSPCPENLHERALTPGTVIRHAIGVILDELQGNTTVDVQ